MILFHQQYCLMRMETRVSFIITILFWIQFVFFLDTKATIYENLKILRSSINNYNYLEVPSFVLLIWQCFRFTMCSRYLTHYWLHFVLSLFLNNKHQIAVSQTEFTGTMRLKLSRYAIYKLEKIITNISTKFNLLLR